MWRAKQGRKNGLPIVLGPTNYCHQMEEMEGLYCTAREKREGPRKTGVYRAKEQIESLFCNSQKRESGSHSPFKGEETAAAL